MTPQEIAEEERRLIEAANRYRETGHWKDFAELMLIVRGQKETKEGAR